MRSSTLRLLVATLVVGVAYGQGDGPTDPVGGARDRTAGPMGQEQRPGVEVRAERERSSVGFGSSMELSREDDTLALFARLPNGISVLVSQQTATLTAHGTLPLSARVEGEAEAHGTGSARLNLNSPGVIQGLLGQLGSLPVATASADASASGSLEVTDIEAAAGIEQKTRGVLVAIPVASSGVSFFAGAEHVEEYVVASVQGFRYAYDYEAEASATVGSPVTGGSATRDWSTSGSGGDRVDLDVEARRGWHYTVAVVGIGYRGERGGFHMLADLEWTGNRPDPQGYVDIGELRQIRMPGPLRDVELGGDFHTVGGFSAGLNVKLVTFGAHAVGGDVDLFVNQHFEAVDIGLSYRGSVRGAMADQTASLQVAFRPTQGTQVTLVGGVRVLSSYMPGFDVHETMSRDWGDSWNRSTGAGPVDLSGQASASGRVEGEVRAHEDERLQHEVRFYPGLRLDLLDTGLSAGGGPILDSDGRPLGGHGMVGYEVVPDRFDVGAGVQHDEGLGTSGGVGMRVLW